MKAKISTPMAMTKSNFGDRENQGRTVRQVPAPRAHDARYHEAVGKHKFAMAKGLQDSFSPKFGDAAEVDLGGAGDRDAGGREHEEPKLSASSPRQAVYSTYKGTTSHPAANRPVRAPDDQLLHVRPEPTQATPLAQRVQRSKE